jgi:hypothetical protein
METKETTVPPKKKRVRRSPEMIVELILRAERTGKAAEICRQEGINPVMFSRWKTKFKEAGVEALRNIKRGPKPKDAKLESVERENERLKTALCEASIELLLLKKSVSSGYMET